MKVRMMRFPRNWNTLQRKREKNNQTDRLRKILKCTFPMDVRRRTVVHPPSSHWGALWAGSQENCRICWCD